MLRLQIESLRVVLPRTRHLRLCRNLIRVINLARNLSQRNMIHQVMKCSSNRQHNKWRRQNWTEMRTAIWVRLRFRANLTLSLKNYKRSREQAQLTLTKGICRIRNLFHMRSIIRKWSKHRPRRQLRTRCIPLILHRKIMNSQTYWMTRNWLTTCSSPTKWTTGSKISLRRPASWKPSWSQVDKKASMLKWSICSCWCSSRIKPLDAAKANSRVNETSTAAQVKKWTSASSMQHKIRLTSHSRYC